MVRTDKMDKLEQAREKINEIDKELARLWSERMAAVADVLAYKQEHSLPVLDTSREAALLEKNLSYICDDLKSYYPRFHEGVLESSKAYQREKMGNSGDVLTLNLGDRSYDIVIRRGSLSRAGELMNLNRKVMIVTDDGVPAEYAKTLAEQCAEPIILTLPHGEATKNIESFKQILLSMLEHGFTRRDCVVAVGGGVMGDLAGFAASAYMRGIDFYNVPTTTLSQIDSSIGGKVAIDFEGFKNTVGAFWQPKLVLIDSNVLRTLDERQISSGLAEAVKMSLCFDADLFEIFERGEVMENLDEIIRRSLMIKKKVVEQDEKEQGLRQVLNFGHTIGHGIETAEEGRLLHGECVALGMLPMCSIKVRERLLRVLKSMNLPTKILANPDKIKAAMLHDKKSAKGGVSIVRVERAGEFTLKKLSFDELFALLDHYLEEENR